MNKRIKKPENDDKQGIISRGAGKVKNFFYDIDSKIINAVRNQRAKSGKPVKVRSASGAKIRSLLFVAAMLALPMFIFCVFYVYRTLNSFFLSFKEYDSATRGFRWLPLNDFFHNFTYFFEQMKTQKAMSILAKNSFYLFLYSIVLSFPLHLLNAFYLYKKFPLHNMFMVFLFLPSVISSVIMVTMFKYFVSIGLPEAFERVFSVTLPNFIKDPEYGFGTQIIYLLWAGFGGSVILYVGLMARIPDSLVESAQLDGITLIKEFWYITLPLIYPTVAIQLAANIAIIFSGAGALYTFFGESAPTETQTFGYYFFVQVLGANGIPKYPYASATGVLFTLIVAPVCLFTRWALLRFGPSETTY